MGPRIIRRLQQSKQLGSFSNKIFNKLPIRIQQLTAFWVHSSITWGKLIFHIFFYLTFIWWIIISRDWKTWTISFKRKPFWNTCLTLNSTAMLLKVSIQHKSNVCEQMTISILIVLDRGTFYMDKGHSFDSILFYGNEQLLFQVEILLFLCFIIISGNFLFAILFLGIVSEVSFVHFSE